MSLITSQRIIGLSISPSKFLDNTSRGREGVEQIKPAVAMGDIYFMVKKKVACSGDYLGCSEEEEDRQSRKGRRFQSRFRDLPARDKRISPRLIEGSYRTLPLCGANAPMVLERPTRVPEPEVTSTFPGSRTLAYHPLGIQSY